MIRYPASLAEIASEEYRPKLLAGIVTGYATATLLLVLVIAATSWAVIGPGLWPFALVGAKLATNTLAAWAWRTRTALIPLSALNIVADVLVMTGAIYYTGGILSPLVALYFIEVSVMALLTNFALTLATTLGCFAFYGAMAIAVHVGALPAVPLVVSSHAELTNGALVVLLGLAALSTFGPGVYVALIVQQLRRSERALAARADELVEASRAKSEFTANVTHELRTPLHGILGTSELLEDGIYGPLTDAQREALAKIQGSASGLLGLIDSLLVLARAEALRLEVNRSAVDVGDVVGSVVANARMLVGRRPLELRAEIASDLPSVETDRQKLVQILVNILANAIKFTPDEGCVSVEAKADEDAVRIAVRDTGKGIPEAMRERIFEPYVQVDGSSEREHGGAGIGLSVVRTLADLLSIEVSVESEPGQGSTFTIRVPIQGRA